MNKTSKILVTGGCGFIGSNYVNNLNEQGYVNILIVDKMTYAADINNMLYSDKFKLEQIDICDTTGKLEQIIINFNPDYVVHMAAESHVDNSINSSTEFIKTNVMGTANLLDICRKLPNLIKFIHVSTDEVFGYLKPTDTHKFNENTPYNPSSPYAASKASSYFVIIDKV